MAAGILMLFGKSVAWWATGSAAILSDALESLIHNVAVAFAAFSLWLSKRPANERYRYGYERISFFSAGFEGALIAAAGVAIIITSVSVWRQGIPIREIDFGIGIVAALGLLNGLLGWHLIRTGRQTQSLILVANGKHVLSDCWTSLGVVGGLALVLITGWKPFDPIAAIVLAVNIAWEGSKLMWQSIRGLLDYADPQAEGRLKDTLESFAAESGIGWHGLRFRETGGRLLVEFHLLFPHEMTVGEAHSIATELENRIESTFDVPVEIVSHLESNADHGSVHHNPSHR